MEKPLEIKNLREITELVKSQKILPDTVLLIDGRKEIVYSISLHGCDLLLRSVRQSSANSELIIAEDYSADGSSKMYFIEKDDKLYKDYKSLLAQKNLWAVQRQNPAENIPLMKDLVPSNEFVHPKSR